MDNNLSARYELVLRIIKYCNAYTEEGQNKVIKDMWDTMPQSMKDSSTDMYETLLEYFDTYLEATGGLQISTFL